jgi:hypothetical protein
MALVRCPDCGREISDAAPACVGCGRPNLSSPQGAALTNLRPQAASNVALAWMLGVLGVVGVVGVVTVVCAMVFRARSLKDPPAGGSVPSTNSGQPLSSDQLQAVVSQHQLAVRRQCIDNGGGSVGATNETVQITIGPSGAVQSAIATGNDPVTGHCLESEIQRWEFPATGTTATVNVPFRFVRSLNPSTGGSGPSSNSGQPLTSDQLQAVVSQHQLEIRKDCVDKGGAAGAMAETVSVVIGPSGAVTSAIATGNDPVTGHCLESEIKRWQFPATGTTATVNMPFKFVRE